MIFSNAQKFSKRWSVLLPKDLFPCRSFEVFEALNSKVSRLVVILLMAKIRRSPAEGKVNYLPSFKQGLKDTISNPVVGVMGFLKHQQYHGNLGLILMEEDF